MFFEVGFLAFQFLGRLVWYMFRCPDLAVRMRIRTSHHCTLILEDLHVMDEIPRGEVRGLLHPRSDDVLGLRLFELGKRQVVTRREANDPAEATLGNGNKQRVV